MLQHRAEPLSRTPTLADVTQRHRGGVAALAATLAAQLRQHSAPQATHVGMLAQLETLAVAAACMLAAAQTHTFDRPVDDGTPPLLPLPGTASPAAPARLVITLERSLREPSACMHLQLSTRASMIAVRLATAAHAATMPSAPRSRAAPHLQRYRVPLQVAV